MSCEQNHNILQKALGLTAFDPMPFSKKQTKKNLIE